MGQHLLAIIMTAPYMVIHPLQGLTFQQSMQSGCSSQVVCSTFKFGHLLQNSSWR